MVEHPAYNKTKEGLTGLVKLLRNCLLKQVWNDRRDGKTRKKT